MLSYKTSLAQGAIIPIVLLCLGCASTRDFGKLDSADAWREAMQPALSAEEQSRIADQLTLKDALEISLQRNPGIQFLRRKWLASIHQEPQATSLPDPMLMAGYQFENVETRVGPQEGNLGLTQKLPWWQKLWARGKVTQLRAEISRLQYEAGVRQLIIQIKDAYYELYYLDRAETITRRIETLLRNEGMLAYSELGGGRTLLNEAFRAESQAAQLAYDRILLTELRAAQAERLRSLLNLPPDTEIGPVQHAPFYQVSSDLGTLFQRAESFAEILKIRGLEIQQAEYQTYLAKLSRIPDISLGLNWISTSSSGSGAPDSGKDPFIGLLSMNLPIWEQRNQALIREKDALESSMQFKALEDTNNVRNAVARTYFQAQLSKRLMELYSQTLLPQAEDVMRQAETDFRAEQAPFSAVLETTLAFHNFTLAYYRAVADHGQAIGRLENVLGTTADIRPPDARDEKAE